MYDEPAIVVGSEAQPLSAQPGASALPPSALAQGKLAAMLGGMELASKGTIVPAENFDAEEDAQKLFEAMKGWGSDDRAMLELLSARSAQQRKDIAKMYKTMYGRDLRQHIKSETSGHFEDTMKRMFYNLAEFDAYELRKAMKGAGTDEAAMIEILCTRSNAEIQAINAAYREMFPGRVLEKDIVSETSGHFKRILVACCQGNRSESTTVDMEKAKREAEELYKAGEKRWGTEESTFNRILCVRSRPQLLATFKEYRKVSSYDITRSIEHEMSGDLKRGMKALVQCIKDRPTYFAERLYHSMKGMGTSDRTLIRLIVGRSEVDLEDIKERFFDMYNKSLAKMIKDDVSGNYKRLLIAICKEG